MTARAYAPNAFSAGAAPGAAPLAAPAAAATALRSYAPNQFGGGGGYKTGNMAAHLSVPESERPGTQDFALIRGSEYANMVPNLPSAAALDKQWRYSPQTYQTKVADMLRGDAGIVLDELKYKDPELDLPTRELADDGGGVITQVFDANTGEWRKQKKRRPWGVGGSGGEGDGDEGGDAGGGDDGDE